MLKLKKETEKKWRKINDFFFYNLLIKVKTEESNNRYK